MNEYRNYVNIIITIYLYCLSSSLPPLSFLIMEHVMKLMGNNSNNRVKPRPDQTDTLNFYE